VTGYTYILSNRKRGVLYVGVTSDLERRIAEHKNHEIAGFTSRYNVNLLVWFQDFDNVVDAIVFEKKIKNRNRQWKIDLIERTNPQWADLSLAWADPAIPLSGTQDDEK